MEGFHFAPWLKWCEITLCYKRYSRALHKTDCGVLQDTQRHSPSLLLSRWSVQLSPTGHKLLVLGSSLADSWQESRRKFLCWSFRAQGPIPLFQRSFSDTLTPPWLGRVGRLVDEGRTATLPSGRFTNTQRGAYLVDGGCLLMFGKLKSAAETNMFIGTQTKCISKLSQRAFATMSVLVGSLVTKLPSDTEASRL